jgi:uncharacterized repeat protein (TIGR03803 family)
VTKTRIYLFLLTVALGVVFCAVAETSASAQIFTTLVSFDGSNGEAPYGVSLVQGLDGDLYGVTQHGGLYNNGVVFKVTTAGSLITLYSFCAKTNCPDGNSPEAPLLQATDGNFYGTTVSGGAKGRGTVFRITPEGVLTTLYSFCPKLPCKDGDVPFGALVEGSDGYLYGTTVGQGSPRYGTVFRITPTGVLTTLYNFCARATCPDGNEPSAGVIQASDGNFYGTTVLGGSYTNCPGEASGCGTIFKITPSGKLTTIHKFCAQTKCTDGREPDAPLVQTADGNFYGTTAGGGVNGDFGTVFKMTTAGKVTTLYSFCSQVNSLGYCSDGAVPLSALVQGPDGNFYGTTYVGGAASPYCGSGNGCGTVFSITPSGVLTTLHSFCTDENCTDGIWSSSAPAQATNGSFYGAAVVGGVNGDGTVFELSMGFGPYVEALPNESKVGKIISILGQGFTGTTAVSFNGTAATFNVVSDTYLTATVPSAATTGLVSVTTPGGVLNSNQAFQVKP